jgi:hypothetical protein
VLLPSQMVGAFLHWDVLSGVTSERKTANLVAQFRHSSGRFTEGLERGMASDGA